MTRGTRGYGGLVLTLFFGSGCTALIYEVVWSKYLALMFGSTIQAQTVVLAVFMGGLALGNRIFGSRSDLLNRPLHAYGIIEIAIGLYAFSFPKLQVWADAAFVAAGTRWGDSSAALFFWKGLFSVGLLLLPTVLMGGTLPLLAAWLQQRTDDPTRRSARFYSVNSLGAVTGSALAGFYLVQDLGLVATLQSAAMVNGVIGLLAIWIERRIPSVSRAHRPAPAPAPAPATAASAGGASCAARSVRHWFWACLLVGVTGGVSMGLEVLASRSLSLVFGSSLQSFAMVLVAFILGIGLGSGVIASVRSPRLNDERTIVWLLLGAAIWVGVLVFKIEWWVEFYRLAKSGLARTSVGYLFYQGLTALLSMIVLGVPAALIGSVLPLLIRIAGAESLALGRQVGRLLTWNTLGAVGGTLLTGFVLMPGVGLRGSFGLLAGCLAMAALLLAWQSARPRLVLASGSALAVIAALFALGGSGWRHVMSSGAFRAKEAEVQLNVMEQRKKHIKILFYEDAPDATVSVEQGDGIGASDDIGLRINGKTDASSRGDLSTQLLISHLPLLARPDARDVFILGLGSGISGGAALGHPIEHLVIAENCEPVIRAATFFNPWNGGVLTDPRTRIVKEDARTVLKLNSQLYDVIITQPSNPWMAGVGSVFSREYYALGASRLKPGGIMVQWLQLYEMHDGIVEMVLRTFGSVFPHVEVWDAGIGDIVLLGSAEPWESGPEAFSKPFDRPAVRRDFGRIGIPSSGALFARQLASQRTGFAIARAGVIQSDLFPVLEYQAPRAFYMGTPSTMLARYDERTWQRELAPPDKSAAIDALDANQVRAIFAEYFTINDDLWKLLAWRYGGQTTNGAGSAGPHPGDRVAAMPSLFRNAGQSVEPRISMRATEEEKELFSAVTALRNRTPAHEEALRKMEAIFAAQSKNTGWPHWNQAAVAAKAAYASGDLARARVVLAAALRHSPNDRDLQYVSQIVERGQPSVRRPDPKSGRADLQNGATGTSAETAAR